MIEFEFDERKATQAAALILDARGGRTGTLALVKLMYLVDRRALLAWGRPVTGDQYFNLPHGPAGSVTCDLVRHNGYSDDRRFDYWSRHIQLGEGRTIDLVAEIDLGALSDDEMVLIESVCSEFDGRDPADLRENPDERSAYPEWRDPERGRVFVPVDELLRVHGAASARIEEIAESASYARVLSASLPAVA